MSRDASLELDWADGRYTFRLAWAELEQLQEACDAGPYVILNRLIDGSWRVADISNVIRLGLIGGGMAPLVALKKIRSYVEGFAPMKNLLIAQAVLSAAVVGAPDEDGGKKGEAANPAASSSTLSRTESSDLPPSTAAEPS